MTTKTCTTCKKEKGLESFAIQKRGKFGRTATCKACRIKYTNAWHARNPERRKHIQLQRKFGISVEQYRAMESAQNGLCAICLQPDSSGIDLAVDHCHTTKKVRALLCGNCNRGIGNLRESPAILYRAIEYLNQHR